MDPAPSLDLIERTVERVFGRLLPPKEAPRPALHPSTG